MKCLNKLHTATNQCGLDLKINFRPKTVIMVAVATATAGLLIYKLVK